MADSPTRHPDLGALGAWLHAQRPALLAAWRVAVGLAGTQAFGPGILAGIGVAPGETWLFQVAYRTLTPSCGTGINWSNAVRLTLTN